VLIGGVSEWSRREHKMRKS